MQRTDLSTAPVYSVFFCFFVLDFINEDCTLCPYVYHKSTTHNGFLWELRFSSQQVAFKFNSINRSSINTPLIATYCWCLWLFYSIIFYKKTCANFYFKSCSTHYEIMLILYILCDKEDYVLPRTNALPSLPVSLKPTADIQLVHKLLILKCLNVRTIIA